MTRRRKIALAACVAASLSLDRAWGANANWTFAGGGSWSDASNWDSIPNPGSLVFIDHTDAIDRQVIYDYSGPLMQLQGMAINNGGAGSAVFSQGANSLTVLNEFVGTYGSGFWELSGGTHLVSGSTFQFGSGTTGFGVATMSSGTLMVSGYEEIAVAGIGIFNQSGGFQNVSKNIHIGAKSDGQGTFRLSSGTLTVGDYDLIGYAGNGTFIQTGGSNTVGINLHLGYDASGNGTYLLSGGTLTVNSYDEIGFNGSGTMNQSGGLHNVMLNVQLGFNPGSKGTYLLSNGVLNTKQYELIGYGSSGTFIQSGGTNSVGLNFHLGWSAPGNGTYLMSGGTLNVSGYDFIGFNGAGTMDQSGGVHNITADLQIGANGGSRGTYTLRDTGILNVGAYGLIGYQSDGTMIQSGGTQTITQNLMVGWGPLATGTYLLSGGQLNSLSNEFIGFDGKGTFIQSGGTNSIGKNNATRDLRLGANNGSKGVYQLSGGTLIVTDGEFVGVNSNATFSQSGGRNTITSVLNIGTLGSFLLSGGTVTSARVTNKGQFSQSGGVISTGTFNTGSLTGSAVGVVQISAGTLNATHIRQQSLSISGNGYANIKQKASANETIGTSIVRSLSITNTSQFDLTNNSLVIDYSTLGTLMDDVRDDLQSGRLVGNGGQTDQGLGYADNAVLGLSNFSGVPVDTTSVLIKYTYFGDSNFDFAVNMSDLDALADHWHGQANWAGGDFNYDGFVDVNDELSLLPNWAGGVESLNTALASLDLPPVPEPAGLVLLAGCLAITRRRQRTSGTA